MDHHASACPPITSLAERCRIWHRSNQAAQCDSLHDRRPRMGGCELQRAQENSNTEHRRHGRRWPPIQSLLCTAKLFTNASQRDDGTTTKSAGRFLARNAPSETRNHHRAGGKASRLFHRPLWKMAPQRGDPRIRKSNAGKRSPFSTECRLR